MVAAVAQGMSREAEQQVDLQLLRRVAHGEQQALADLYERHGRPLFRYLLQLVPDRGVAEEVLQDTLVAVWKSAHTFQGKSRVETWLFGVAHRQAHNTLRRRGLPLADIREIEALPSTLPEPETSLLATIAREELTESLGRLAPLHREILHLIFVRQLSYQECADVLDVPVGTIRSRLSTARRALRALLSLAKEGEQ